MLGLDWGGNSSLKYVLLRRTTVGLKLQVETFGRISVTADAPEAVYEATQALHELFMRERRFKKAKIVVGLGTEKVILKKESFPPLSAKELRQTFEFGVKKDLGLEGEDAPVVVDSFPLGPDPAVQGNTEYLCFGAELRLISERAGAISEQGVIPVKVIPNILAVRNLLDQLPKSKTDDSVCFLEIGAIRSILVFFRKGQVDFYREIVIGGDDFTKAITGTIFHEGRAIQFTNKEALEFKHKHGYPLGFSEGMTFRGAPLAEVGAMMRPVVERLTGEIHRSIGFYSEKTGGGSIKALYMTGGGAQLRHLSQVLTERLGISTSVLPPLTEIRVSGGVKQEQQFRAKYLEYGTALALALETGSSKGNLLPPEFTKLHAMAFIQRCLNWAAVILLMTVGILSGLDYLSLKSLKGERKVREKTAEIVSKKVFRYENFMNSKNAIAERLLQFDEKIKQDPGGVNVLRLITSAVPKSLSLVSVRIGQDLEAAKKASESKSRSRSQTKTADASTEDAGSERMKPVRIEGQSKLSIPDIRISVAQFMLSLSKSGYLTDVKLQDEKLDEQKDEYLFVIEGTANL